MTYVCVCCGKEFSSSIGTALHSSDGKVLCKECAKPFKGNLYNIKYSTSVKEFMTHTTELSKKALKIYSRDKAIEIINMINEAYQKRGFYFSLEMLDRAGDDVVYEISHVGVMRGSPIASKSAGMFNNIAEKIKVLAAVLTYIGIAFSLLIGFWLISIELYLVGVLVILFGCLIAWISSFVLYGFGQLVENSDTLVKIAKQTNKDEPRT